MNPLTLNIILILIFALILWIGTMIVFAMAVREIMQSIEANTSAKKSLIKMQLNAQYGKTIDVSSLYPVGWNEDKDKN
jgi:hypothetical protein